MKKRSTKLLFLICCLTFVCCTTSREVSYRQAMAIKPDRNYLTINTGKKRYTLVNYEFSDTGLEGTIIKFRHSKEFPIQVYADMSYFRDLDKNLNKRIKINSSSIKRITIKKRDAKKTGQSFLEFFAHLFHGFVSFSQ